MDLRRKGFQLPEKIEFEAENLTHTYGKIKAEAFERGFGTTMGNALRRVLLSSIEGAAVTSIRMPGVLHEFSTVSGIKEDIIDVVLNVKQLRFKMHTDVPKVVTIDVKGPKDVTGKDITPIAQVEILTPDQHIATVEKGVNFNMELTVRKGRGYTPAERNKTDDMGVDVLAIDSIFSPIRKVNYVVESARVGRSTDYDRLIMEIWTDGSITPQQAFSEAANILKGHVSLFSVEEEAASGEEYYAAEAGDEDRPAIFNEYLLKSVDELELSVRSYNCLKNANIRTIADLVQKSEQEMLRTKNFGRKSLSEIKEVLLSMGLHFNMRIDVDALKEAALAKERQ